MTEPAVENQNTITPLSFEEEDPTRPDQEQRLKDMSDDELREIYWVTRRAAKEARLNRDMDGMYRFVRGTKTIQRISSGRGMLISARRPESIVEA